MKSTSNGASNKRELTEKYATVLKVIVATYKEFVTKSSKFHMSET